MTQDEIIKMARESGFKMENSAAVQAAKAFYKLVAAKEREACAQYCDMNSHSPIDMASILAEAIRARGEA